MRREAAANRREGPGPVVNLLDGDVDVPSPARGSSNGCHRIPNKRGTGLPVLASASRLNRPTESSRQGFPRLGRAAELVLPEALLRFFRGMVTNSNGLPARSATP